jgi:hypothetical protein
MRPSAWRRSWVMGLWLGAIALAVAAVRLGDLLRATRGDATAFYVGSLFMWIMWIPWIVTFLWLGARERQTPGRYRFALVLLGVLGGLWLLLTVFEYL